MPVYFIDLFIILLLVILGSVFVDVFNLLSASNK